MKQMGGDDWTILVPFVRTHAKSQVVVNSFNEKYRIQVFSWAFLGLFVGGKPVDPFLCRKKYHACIMLT